MASTLSEKSHEGQAEATHQPIADLTAGPYPGTLVAMIPYLPTLTGASGAWALLALKAIAAVGFMTAANVFILYAC